MRNIFLLLVLLNLGALAFFSWVIGEPEPSLVYDGAGITLLRELDPDAPISSANSANLQTELSAVVEELAVIADDAPFEASSISTEAVVDSTEPAEIATVASEQTEADGNEAPQFSRCISIGPFSEALEADAAMATLTEAGFDPSPSIREVDVWDGYWVYIEQIGDMAAARAIQADLAENDLQDTQIVSASDRGNLLSLGVFSEITRAGSQAERVNRIGYEATIADNMTTTETQWLDIMLSSEQSVAIETLQAPGRISRLELLSCTNGEDD